MKQRKLAGALTLLAAVILVVATQPARADGLALNVTIDTSALGTSGPSEIFFSFTDGNQPASGGNTAMVSAFTFGGGSTGLVDGANTFGDVTSGTNLSDGATLVTDQPFNQFAGFFTAGSNISFLLNLTTNVAPGAAAPDLFSIYVADPNGNFVPSNDPSGFDSLLNVTIDSSNPTTTSYTSAVTYSPAGGPVPTPEPSSLLLLAGGLLSLVTLKRVLAS